MLFFLTSLFEKTVPTGLSSYMINKHLSSIFNTYLPIAIFIICFAFKFAFIDKRDISIDEPFSIFHAQQDLKHIFNLSTEGEPNTPLFLIILHFWIKIFGYDGTLLRILPLIFNSLTAVIIYKIGKRFFNVQSAIAASLMFILSLSQFFHGLEVRTYSMFILATALTLYCFLNVVRKGSVFNVILLVVSNLFVVYSHYFGWFIIISEGIATLLFFNKTNTLKRLGLSLGLTIIGFVPMIRIMINQFFLSNRGTWLSSPSAGDFKKELLFVFNHQSLILVFKIILIVGVALMLFRYFIHKEWKPNFNTNYIMLLLWSVIPFSLMYFISSKIPIFTGRYILYTAPAFYLLATVTISTLYNKIKLLEIIALLVTVIVMGLHLRILPHDFGWRDIKKAAIFIRHKEKELDDRIIIIYPAWTDLELVYHYDLELFKNYTDYKDNCRKRGLIGAWYSNNVAEIALSNKNKDIILLSNTGSGETEIMNCALHTSHTFIKKAAFPEFYNVGIYKTRE